MDKLSQLRQMREHRQRGFAALRRQLSAAEIKDVADRAEARSSAVEPLVHNGLVAGSNPVAPTKPMRKLAESVIATKFIRTEKEFKLIRNEGKPAMTEAAPQVWSKGLYQKLYMTMQRARTDDERTAAETALRTAFPKTRPRKVKAVPVEKTVKVAAPKKKKTARKKVKATPIKSKAKPAARKKQAKKKKGRR